MLMEEVRQSEAKKKKRGGELEKATEDVWGGKTETPGGEPAFLTRGKQGGKIRRMQASRLRRLNSSRTKQGDDRTGNTRARSISPPKTKGGWKDKEEIRETTEPYCPGKNRGKKKS